jgi:hypothetical protein
MRWKSLQSFGRPNTFTQQVNNELGRTEVETAGAFPADQPVGADRRAIMTALTFSYTTRPGGRGLDKTDNDPSGVSDCDNCRGTDGFPAYLPIWNFESWQGGPGTRLMTDQSPNARTSLFFAGGPYWNVANSARYYDPEGDSNPANNATYRLGRQLDFCFRSDVGAYPSLDCQVARLRAISGSFGWNSPKSPFTGSIRFNEFNFVDLENYDPRNRRLFTDPYGDFKAFSSDVNFVTRTRSAEMPIRQYLGLTTRRLSVVADNWAGSKSCGSRECWTDFRWYKRKDGTWIDTQVHAPN